jgi:hypothetical protein
VVGGSANSTRGENVTHGGSGESWLGEHGGSEETGLDENGRESRWLIAGELTSGAELKNRKLCRTGV